MRTRTLSIVAGLVVVAAGLPAIALWGRIPDDKPFKTDLPPILLKAVNANKRVWGEAGDHGWEFRFRGSTKDLNAFLAQLAGEKTVPLEAVLVPEPGSDEADSFKDMPKVEYEWALWVYRPRDIIRIFERKDGESEAAYEERRTAELAKLPKYEAVVTIHCVGAIDPAALKIPLPFATSVGGQLADLSRVHNDRKARFTKEGKSVAGQPPTDMQAVKESGGLFGGPSTKPAAGDGE